MCNKTKETIFVKTFFVFSFFLFFHATLYGIFSNYQDTLFNMQSFQTESNFEYFFFFLQMDNFGPKVPNFRSRAFLEPLLDFFVTFLRPFFKPFMGNFFQCFLFPSSMTSIGNPRDWSFWTKSAEFLGQMAPILLKSPPRVKLTIWRLILSL